VPELLAAVSRRTAPASVNFSAPALAASSSYWVPPPTDSSLPEASRRLTCSARLVVIRQTPALSSATVPGLVSSRTPPTGVRVVVPSVNVEPSACAVPPEPPNELTWFPEESTIWTVRACWLPRVLLVIAVPDPSCRRADQVPDWVAATVPVPTLTHSRPTESVLRLW
jgi:hypothetical protein